MLRLFIPFVLFLIAVVAVIYILFVKKDVVRAKKIFSITLFFAVIWTGIYYFLFR